MPHPKVPRFADCSITIMPMLLKLWSTIRLPTTYGYPHHRIEHFSTMIWHTMWLTIIYGEFYHIVCYIFIKLWSTVWLAASYGCPHHRAKYTTWFASFSKNRGLPYSQQTLMVTYARWLAIPYGGQDHMFAMFYPYYGLLYG